MSGIPVTDDSVQHVISEDLCNKNIKARIDVFNSTLTKHLNNANFILEGPFDGRYGSLDNIAEAVDPAHGDGSTTPTDDNYDIPTDTPDVDNVSGPDKYLNATILMDQTEFGKPNLATVIGRNIDSVTGKPKSESHNNPVLDNSKYLVELTNGTTEMFLANQIAENLWAQCDSEGCEFMNIREIVGHRTNATAITKGLLESTYGAGNGTQVPTTHEDN